MSRSRRAVLIAGPTASGKSALALRKARELGGVVINADAMQVYRVLSTLTARPTLPEMEGVPHLLYGTVAPRERFSTGSWLEMVQEFMDYPELRERPLVFVGGTGLYFEVLQNGIAATPQVPAEVTAEVTAEVAGLDREARAALIAERDPAMASRLRSPDPQRVIRALAVLKATGQSLAAFQGTAQAGLLDGFEVERIVLNPDREVLRERIAKRFNSMLLKGAVQEVKALRLLELDASLPAMKAIGVREISDWLGDRIDRETAIERAVIATRQYAKRQRTWFRNRMADWNWIDPLA